MKYSEEQKKILKDKDMLNFRPFQKEPKQQELQEMIDNHYPVKEFYFIVESKINKP
jgi:hypothetical protein